MKINNIFESLVRDSATIYDPRHLYEDFKREQIAIERLTEAPTFKMPNIKPAAKKPSVGGDDLRNPSAARKGGKLTGRDRGAEMPQDQKAKKPLAGRGGLGDTISFGTSGPRSGNVQRSSTAFGSLADENLYGKADTTGVDADTTASISADKARRSADDAVAKTDRDARRAAVSTYRGDDTGYDTSEREIAGDDYLSSAAKKWKQRTNPKTGAVSYNAELHSPRGEVLTDIESSGGKREESDARLSSTSGDYTRKFEKARTAHAKSRGVPQLGGTEESKEKINDLAMRAKKDAGDRVPHSSRGSVAGTGPSGRLDKQIKGSRALSKGFKGTDVNLDGEPDTQAMTDLYDASLNFLMRAANKVLSKAGVSGERQTSLLDDSFQEASRLWFDAVKKYKMADGDFENFMRSHVSSGVKNWAGEELRGAPTSRWATSQVARLNKIKSQIKNDGGSDTNLDLAVEMWNQQEDEKADENINYTPRYTTSKKLRKLELQGAGWGSTDNTIEGTDGEEVSVGSTIAGGDSGEMYGQSGASEHGGIGVGSSPEEDMEKMEREVNAGGSKEGLAQLGQALTQAGIGGDDLEIFSKLWGLGGEAPQSEKDVERELDITRYDISQAKKRTTKKLVNYLRDDIGWEEAEIRNYLSDIFDERFQLHNLATGSMFDNSDKKEGGDKLTQDYMVANKKLDSIRTNRAAKKGPIRSAERKARQAELMPKSGPMTSGRGGMTDKFDDKSSDIMKDGGIGAENHKLLQKRYRGVESALGKIDDADDISAWYDKANKYMASTYGIDMQPGGDPIPREKFDLASKEFQDRIDAARDAKVAELAQGKGMSTDEYVTTRDASLAKGDQTKNITVDKNEGKRGNLDYVATADKDTGIRNQPSGAQQEKEDRIKAYMDMLGLSKEEAEEQFEKRFGKTYAADVEKGRNILAQNPDDPEGDGGESSAVKKAANKFKSTNVIDDVAHREATDAAEDARGTDEYASKAAKRDELHRADLKKKGREYGTESAGKPDKPKKKKKEKVDESFSNELNRLIILSNR